MSMYEIEGLVEESIQTLNKSKNDSINKKNLIWNLYNSIQSNFDCSYTHFRVIDILLKNSFIYQINITEHPDYKKYEKYFNKIEQEERDTFILKNPTKEWDRTENCSIGFYNTGQNKIYFDYGSLLWGKLIKNEDEEGPVKLEVFEIVLLMMKEAHKIENIPLIYEWFGFTMNYYDWFSNNKSFEENKNTYLNEMKDIYMKSGADKNIREHHSTLHIHNKEELKKIAVYFDEKLLKIFEWFIE